MRTNSSHDVYINGIPESVPAAVAAVCRSRLLNAVDELMSHTDSPDVYVEVGTAGAFRQKWLSGRRAEARLRHGAASDDRDAPHPDRYTPGAPRFSFEQLVLPQEVQADLLAAIDVITVEKRVFDDWGLRQIEPFPRSAVNLHGPPGTGKTLTAHAMAQRLGRRILVASYADIESKYHGDGPKNVQAIFQAAERDSAVLFIDEADSLLSRRLTQVTQGSEQAINSMRSQLLINLEQFHGVVIFSTNLVENYDTAFETRVRHIHFPLPDLECRKKLWRQHLVPSLPVHADVDCDGLAKRFDDICGRDIKNAVIDAAVRVAVADQPPVTMENLVRAVEGIKAARIRSSHSQPLTPKEAAAVTDRVAAALHKSE